MVTIFEFSLDQASKVINEIIDSSVLSQDPDKRHQLFISLLQAITIENKDQFISEIRSLLETADLDPIIETNLCDVHDVCHGIWYNVENPESSGRKEIKEMYYDRYYPCDPKTGNGLVKAYCIKFSKSDPEKEFSNVTLKLIKSISEEISRISQPKPQQKMPEAKNYKVLISQSVIDKIKEYHQKLTQEQNQNQTISSAGKLLREQINQLNSQNPPIKLEEISTEGFIQLLINTKKTKVFAECEKIAAENEIDTEKNWNKNEAQLLGGINFSVPVEIYDNGVWDGSGIKKHEIPFQGTLLFTPGALLMGPDGSEKAVDYDTVTKTEADGTIDIDEDKYFKLYEERLLPLLTEANNQSSSNQKAFITIPGIGCGIFAGKFTGKLGAKLKTALEKILETHASKLPNIAAVYFDPRNTSLSETNEISGINFITADGTKPQLLEPEAYDKKYKGCQFFSVVAWDHLSWPGNDYWNGSRHTDDGVKAAATNCMTALTGIEGEYNEEAKKFVPRSMLSWSKVSKDKGMRLEVSGRIYIPDAKGKLQKLEPDTKRIGAANGLATIPSDFGKPSFELAVGLARIINAKKDLELQEEEQKKQHQLAMLAEIFPDFEVTIIKEPSDLYESTNFKLEPKLKEFADKDIVAAARAVQDLFFKAEAKAPFFVAQGDSLTKGLYLTNQQVDEICIKILEDQEEIKEQKKILAIYNAELQKSFDRVDNASKRRGLGADLRYEYQYNYFADFKDLESAIKLRDDLAKPDDEFKKEKKAIQIKFKDENGSEKTIYLRHDEKIEEDGKKGEGSTKYIFKDGEITKTENGLKIKPQSIKLIFSQDQFKDLKIKPATAARPSTARSKASTKAVKTPKTPKPPSTPQPIPDPSTAHNPTPKPKAQRPETPDIVAAKPKTFTINEIEGGQIVRNIASSGADVTPSTTMIPVLTIRLSNLDRDGKFTEEQILLSEQQKANTILYKSIDKIIQDNNQGKSQEHWQKAFDYFAKIMAGLIQKNITTAKDVGANVGFKAWKGEIEQILRNHNTNFAEQGVENWMKDFKLISETIQEQATLFSGSAAGRKYNKEINVNGKKQEIGARSYRVIGALLNHALNQDGSMRGFLRFQSKADINKSGSGQGR